MTPRQWLMLAAGGSALVVIIAMIVASVGAQTARDYGRTPVLLVHGHGMEPEHWQPLLEHLRRSGYPDSYLQALDIEPSRMANVAAAEAFIAPAADALLARAQSDSAQQGHTGPRRIALVAHSMGAVSSRWYAARMRPDLVRSLIAIAGANHGTDALCNHTDDGAVEMCPAFAETVADSDVQLQLNGSSMVPVDETPFGTGSDRSGIDSVPPEAALRIVYFTVRIEPDEWIQPASSALLGGAGGVRVSLPPALPVRETSPGNYLLRVDEDHVSVLANRELLRLVEVLLRAAEE